MSRSPFIIVDLIQSQIHTIHHEVWDEISYPLLNFNGAAVEAWE